MAQAYTIWQAFCAHLTAISQIGYCARRPRSFTRSSRRAIRTLPAAGVVRMAIVDKDPMPRHGIVGILDQATIAEAAIDPDQSGPPARAVTLQTSQTEEQMHYFSKHVTTGFDDALAATKQALERHQFVVLGEVDLRDTLKKQLAVDFRPYTILNVFCRKLAQCALEADDETGSTLLSTVVVQEHRDGCVEVSMADPADTMGAINHIEMIQTAQKLRCRLQATLDDIDASKTPMPAPRHSGAAGPPYHAA